MRVLIQTLGSAGDVHPFLALGCALRERGHGVHILGNGAFADAAAAMDLSFEIDGPKEDYEALIRHPDLWNPRKGLKLIMGTLAGPHLRSTVERIEGHLPRTDVVVSSTLGFASRVVRESHDVPLVSAHLAPSAFRSSVRMPRFEGMFVRDRSPGWLKRMWWRLVDMMVRRALGKGLPALRAERGLPLERAWFDRWIHSPDGVLGLFPEWFGPSQPDWPDNVRLMGFPLFGSDEPEPLAPELDAWLEGGSPPLVFTGGSANMGGASFFREALAWLQARRRRGVFVAPNAAAVPADLGPDVRHETYVPFESLFPRAYGLVSHGGVGTCAQALRAGLPHVVASLAFDQVDNGSRLLDLGAGLHLPRRKFKGRRAAEALDLLVGHDRMRAIAASMATRVDPVAARDAACAAIEAAAAGTWPSA